METTYQVKGRALALGGAFVARKGTYRPALEGVNLGGDGVLRATSGHVAVRVAVAVEALEGSVGVTVPPSVLQALKPKPDDDVTVNVFQERKDGGALVREVHQAMTGTALFTFVPPSTYEFPILDKVLPKDSPVSSVWVNPILLGEALLAIGKYLGAKRDASTDGASVRLDVFGAEKPIRIVAGPASQVVSLVMPVRAPDSSKAVR